MFEVGFSEMVLIGIVALIVLGPERLPKAARLAGLWIRRVRAYWFNMRAELERELAAEEMRKQLEDAKQSVQSVDAEVRHLSQTSIAADAKPANSDAPAAGEHGGAVVEVVNGADVAAVGEGDVIKLADVRENVGGKNRFRVKNETKGTEFEVELDISPRLRDMLLAGGLLNYTKNANA